MRIAALGLFSLALALPGCVPEGGGDDACVPYETGEEGTGGGAQGGDGFFFDEPAPDPVNVQEFYSDRIGETSVDPPEDEAVPRMLATWQYDSASDTYYRSATPSELLTNSWPANTVVMASPTLEAALTNGGRSVLLALPLPDAAGGLQIQYESLERKQSNKTTTFLAHREGPAGPITQAFRPEFHLFLQSWIGNLNRLRLPRGQDTFVVAFGDDHGGVAVSGMTPDKSFSLIGPAPGEWLETPVPTPTAGLLILNTNFETTNVEQSLQIGVDIVAEHCSSGTCAWQDGDDINTQNCADCIDNDNDGDTDQPEDFFCKHREDLGCYDVPLDEQGDPLHNHLWENSKDFAIMPDIRWCTEMQAAGIPWHTWLQATGSMAATILNGVGAATAMQPGFKVPDDVPTHRYRLSMCMFADNVDAADACIDTGAGCPAGYAGGDLGNLMFDQVFLPITDPRAYTMGWDHVEVAANLLGQEGEFPPPVASAMTLHWLGGTDGVDIGTVSELGTASFANFDTSNPERFGGGGVENQNTNQLTEAVLIAHEIGHTYGLSHTDDPTSFMSTNPPGSLSTLGNYSEGPLDPYENASVYQTWVDVIGRKDTPRGNAFKYKGCSGNGQCPSGSSCFNAGPDGICRP